MDLVHGLRKTTNSSGHPVLWLHYSADPDKNEAWIAQEELKYVDGGRNSIRWRGEMEMDFEAGSGELVFTTFTENKDRIIVDPFPIDESFVLYGGMDWGTRNPVAFHVYAESVDKRFFAVWEYYAERQPLFSVAQAIRSCPFYDRLQWIACDPTMFNETVARKDGFTSIAEMLSDEEIVGENTITKLMPAHGRSDETGINVTKNMWASDPVQFQIFSTCGNLIREIQNLKYPTRTGRKNATEKIVDKANHCWDDWKYFRLSHPFAAIKETKAKYGTVQYLNNVSDLSAQIAEQSGKPIQEVFNDLYGQEF